MKGFFDLPAEVRNLVWRRMRWLRRREHLETKLRRPHRHPEYSEVKLPVNETKLVCLTWHNCSWFLSVMEDLPRVKVIFKLGQSSTITVCLVRYKVLEMQYVDRLP